MATVTPNPNLDRRGNRRASRTELSSEVETDVRPNLSEQRNRREGFFTRMVKAPFRFAWKHPVLTTLGAVAAAVWGVPWLARQVGNIEGGLSSVPMNRMLDHFRRGAAPLSDTMPVTPMMERPPATFG